MTLLLISLVIFNVCLCCIGDDLTLNGVFSEIKDLNVSRLVLHLFYVSQLNYFFSGTFGSAQFLCWVKILGTFTFILYDIKVNYRVLALFEKALRLA